MEHECYRLNIAEIKNKVGDKELLMQKDVAAYCGITRQTAAKMFFAGQKYITVTSFAKSLCKYSVKGE